VDRGFVFWAAQSEVLQGIAIANFESPEDGLDLAERGLENWIATGAQLHVPTWSAYIADAALLLDLPSRAEELVSEALQLSQTRGESFALAELERLTGELLLRNGNQDAGRQMIERSRTTARTQGTALFELRATKQLAQSLLTNSESSQARAILQPIMDTHPQHRAGSDYQDASALLASCRK
jgi:predicted ATPase